MTTRRPTVHVTPERLATTRRMLAVGYTPTEIHAATGLSESTISRIKRNWPRYCPPDPARVLARAQALQPMLTPVAESLPKAPADATEAHREIERLSRLVERDALEARLYALGKLR